MRDIYKPPFDTTRQIHLDFHTPDFVKVGEKFDAVEFFDTLEEARVNAIAVFALCHHGNSYFDTKTGVRHPGLDFDMFGQMCAEAEKRPIELLGYFSMNVNEVQAALHPEWHALRSDGAPVNSQILQDGFELYWTWLCTNRGRLLEDFLYPHINESFDLYKYDGIFIDMAGYLADSCFCDQCREMMLAEGLDPDDPVDHNNFNFLTIQKIAREFRQLLDTRRPGLRLEMGGFTAYGEAHKAKGVLSDIYIESLAYQTGFDYFPVAARYYRRFGLPIIGYTGRFLKSWGDFGTILSSRQLKTQVAMHLMAGTASGIGDHMDCNGQLNKAVYKNIGEAFRFVEERQPYCVGMEPVPEIGVVVPQGFESNAATLDLNNPFLGIMDANKAVAKLMAELHYQYDMIDRDEKLDDFAAVFVNDGMFGMDFVNNASEYASNGGWVVVGTHALWPGDAVVRDVWTKLIGVRSFGFSDHEGEFYEVTDKRIGGENIPEMAHRIHMRAIDAEFEDVVETLAVAWRSPNANSREKHYGHYFGPPSTRAGTALGCRRVGQGGFILVRGQILAAYLQTGYFVHREVIRNILDTFVPAEKRVLRTNAPSLVEFSFGKKDGRYVLQALPFVADRRDRFSFESLNEPVEFTGLWVDVVGLADARRVYDPISGQDVPFEKIDGSIRIHLPPVSEHMLVLLEV